MLPLTGYADRLSVRPGEIVKFHIANATGAKVDAHIVRVISADPNPAGSGIKTADIAAHGLQQIAEPAPRASQQGSYACIWVADKIAPPDNFTIVLNLWSSRSSERPQTVMEWRDMQGTDGLRLSVSADSTLEIVAGDEGADPTRGRTRFKLDERTWTTIACAFDLSRKRVSLVFFDASDASAKPVEESFDVKFFGGTALFLSGPSDQEKLGFNGKIEAPKMFDRALSPDEIAAAARGEDIPGLIAAWDFSRDMHTSRVVDTGPLGLHGTLVNSPTRAVRGSTWTGREQCYRHAPEQYAAIHFHDDDIDDCRWAVTHEYTVPKDLKSGAYALLLKAGDAAENIPFFVVPPKGTQSAKLAVLVSTFTYTVYGNHARPEWTVDPKWRDAWIKQAAEWKAYPHNPGAHREYGLSTYNHHTDGSGIALASWQRPMLNLRIGYVTYPYPDIRASGLRHYPADSHLLAWLEAKGHDYDLITDWELHHEGVDLLKRYTCVMTGTHPEYHTGEMLDALEAYRDGGGRFMYLGGNGFYWKIALSPEKPGVIEIRRAEGGIRAWAAEPGEYYNQFDGEYGGLWRRNGRPPQQLVGVGFTAQGNFVGSHYRIMPEAKTDARTAWMFAGITEATIGGFGFSGHGAAGFELDRTDMRLGTPANAVVVARSENHPPEAPWVLVPEEQLTHITTIPGESHKQLIRADMTYFETPNNGAVFSTGSITFCGSLPHNDFDNSISTLLGNVLRRFLGGDLAFPIPA